MLSPLSRFFALALVLLVALSASAPIRPVPRVAKEEKESFSESPAQKFIENLPATPNLPRSMNRGASIPAFEPKITVQPPWTALGPFPIPNGQTQVRSDPVSGRVSAIAVHPTNPLIAYVG